MNCPVCSTQVMPGAAFCDNCGSPLQSSAPSIPTYGQPTMMSADSCSSCGEMVTPGEAFCGNCGSALAAAAPLPPTQMGIAPTGGGYTPQPTYAPSGGSSSCTSCGSGLQPGSQFCDNCGASVSQPQSPQADQQTYVPQPPPYTPPEPTYTPPQHDTYTPSPPAYTPPAYTPPPQASSATPRFVVQASNISIAVPAGKSEVLIGREDPVSNHFPDVDLTAHGGDEGGVGRKHATLRVQGNQVTLEDNQSVNGTYVNRQRLQTGNRHPLSNGDEVRFGRVVLTYYQS